MSDCEPLNSAQADAVFDVLAREAGAPERTRREFKATQTRMYCDEFRFMGALGFGGKFRRGPNRRPDGSFGETWRVDCYPEDRSEHRDAIVETTNAELEALRSALTAVAQP